MSDITLKAVSLSCSLASVQSEECTFTPQKIQTFPQSSPSTLLTPKKLKPSISKFAIPSHIIGQKHSSPNLQPVHKLIQTFLLLKQNTSLKSFFFFKWAAKTYTKSLYSKPLNEHNTSTRRNSLEFSDLRSLDTSKSFIPSNKYFIIDNLLSSDPNIKKRLTSTFITSRLRRFLRLQDSFFRFCSIVKSPDFKQIATARKIIVKRQLIFKGISKIFMKFFLFRFKNFFDGCNRIESQEYILRKTLKPLMRLCRKKESFLFKKVVQFGMELKLKGIIADKVLNNAFYRGYYAVCNWISYRKRVEAEKIVRSVRRSNELFRTMSLLCVKRVKAYFDQVLHMEFEGLKSILQRLDKQSAVERGKAFIMWRESLILFSLIENMQKKVVIRRFLNNRLQIKSYKLSEAAFQALNSNRNKKKQSELQSSIKFLKFVLFLAPLFLIIISLIKQFI